jgi:hypothetical protein
MKLYGDFDEISALELLKALTDHGSGPLDRRCFKKILVPLTGNILTLHLLEKINTAFHLKRVTTLTNVFFFDQPPCSL